MGLIGLGTAFTPWVAGLGLLVSFTASAGTETTLGSSRMAWRDGRIVPALPVGTVLIGASPLRDGAGAILAVAPAETTLSRPVGDEPLRGDLKAGARVFPLVERGAKGDPVRAPEPSFARTAATVREAGASLLFANLTGNVTGLMTPGSATWNPEKEPEAGFVPVPDLGLGRAEGATNGEAEAEAPRTDGSTPPVPRAVALSSTTPAPADATPVEVAAASLMLPGFSIRTDRPEAPVAQSVPADARQRYAALIEPEAMDKEQRCLAEAVYFESRSEPEAGQAAVAQVVLNRVKSGLYPTNVCGVVYQNRHRYMGCQFSFACEGKALRITDSGSWATATRIAKSVIEGRTYLAEVGDSTHYHADYVKPGWSRRLRKMDAIGRHIFYQLKPGQT